MFNATPAVAVMGAWGIIALWKRANWNGLVRTWKKFGIRTPADRITGARKAVWKTPAFSAIFLIMILLGGQQMTYGLDSAIPGTTDAEDEIDEKIYNVILMLSDGVSLDSRCLTAALMMAIGILVLLAHHLTIKVGMVPMSGWRKSRFTNGIFTKTSICIMVGLRLPSNEYRGTPICC